MKKLLVISLITIAFLSSCGSSDNNKEAKKQNTTTSESVAKEKTYVKVMSYNDFIKKVWDFEANPNEFTFKGERPCVIDFYATWCGPCKMVAPILEKLAQEYDGKVDFYKVDTDKEQKLASILKIQYLPTVFFAKNGAQPDKSVGAKDEAFFREQINKLLGE
ncbi:MAG: thioredoxin [Bacteroidetes bacterium]|jgi:thioredoxin|nr:thioredoxin [Bacteroidota bacterium]